MGVTSHVPAYPEMFPTTARPLEGLSRRWRRRPSGLPARERHHRPQAGADHLDRVVLALLAQRL